MDNLLEGAVNKSRTSHTSIVSVSGHGVSVGASDRVVGVEGESLDALGVRPIEGNVLALREALRDSVSRGHVVSEPLESDRSLSSQVVVTGKSVDNGV